MPTDPDLPPGLDETLTAYLDDELPADARRDLEARLADDATARERLALLRRGRPPAAAFDAVLAMAPTARLEAMLAAAETRPAPRRHGFGALRAVAAALMLVAAAALGYALARATAPTEVAEAPNWRSVVADYVSLYTPETFAMAPTDPEAYAPRLDVVGEGLGVDLTPQAVALPGLDLRGAVLFHYDGKPLGQVSYLSTEFGPVAFCIIRNGRPDAPPAFEERRGLNVVFWNAGGLGFLVIGGMPRETLEAMAGTLADRVS
jgi:anti-sigma factor RsiW